MRPGAAPKSRRGIALPTAIVTLVAMSVLAVGLFTFGDLGAKSVRNRESAVRAQHVAEAAAHHTLGLMRGDLKTHSFSRILKGADNVAGNADDSLLINWAGVAVGDQIPAAGQSYQGHTYFAKVFDDPADNDGNVTADMNGRIRILCRAVTADGSTAEVEAIIGAVPQPGIAADGNLGFAGAGVVVAGACGGVHSNGNLSATGGGPLVATLASATGTVTGNFGAAPKVPGADEVVIPDLNPMNYCAGSDFNLTVVGGVGYVQNTSTMVTSPAPSGGWVWNNGSLTWSINGTPTFPAAGTYCVQGNVAVSGSTGSPGLPKPLTILATGSIRVEGQPYMTADHPDGIQLMAGGDIYLAGNPAAGTISYQGMVYARSQCSAQGSATVNGQLLCGNAAQPAGAIDWAPANTVTGNFKVNFDCSGNVFNKRRIMFWYPRVGI